jgi:hypothetical protein
MGRLLADVRSGFGKTLRRALNLAQRSTALPDLPESFAFTARPRPCRQGKARFKLPLRRRSHQGL